MFKINPDGTTTEIKVEGPIKDALDTNEVYVIIDDTIRKVFLWKGIASSVRLKFIGAKRSQDIRGQVGLHYSSASIDESDEDDDFLKVIGGKTEAGIAKEIKDEEDSKAAAATSGANPLMQKPTFGAPRPAAGMNIAGSATRAASNAGPLYTGGAMPQYGQDQAQVNFDVIMQKLEEIAIPEGYERELIIIGSHAYSVVERVQKFLGKEQVEKVIERVGSIPEGVFFAEDYSPRVLSKNGSILAIEFLKSLGPQKTAPKDKKQILKDQLKVQLG